MFLKQVRIRLGLKEKRAFSLNEEIIKMLSFQLLTSSIQCQSESKCILFAFRIKEFDIDIKE